MSGTYTHLLYHIVFSTKNRLPLITDTFKQDLYAYMGGIIRGEQGILLEIGGTQDHVHLLVRLKPNQAVSDILRKLKANSSKRVNETYSRARKFGWQDGFAAFTVSESQVAAVRKYIRSQVAHHSRRDFKAEFVELLRKHGVEFEEKFLWT